MGICPRVPKFQQMTSLFLDLYLYSGLSFYKHCSLDLLLDIVIWLISRTIFSESSREMVPLSIKYRERVPHILTKYLKRNFSGNLDLYRRATYTSTTKENCDTMIYMVWQFNPTGYVHRRRSTSTISIVHTIRNGTPIYPENISREYLIV